VDIDEETEVRIMIGSGKSANAAGANGKSQFFDATKNSHRLPGRQAKR
jgi:hypothetical protein